VDPGVAERLMPLSRLRANVEAFTARHVAVVGDLILDEYVYGKPSRISREAPVVILRFTSREGRLGGAANACHNVHALGARVTPIGPVGDDSAGGELVDLLGRRGIGTACVVTERGRATAMKTRVMAGGYQATRQQVVRVDREPSGPPDGMTEARILELLAELRAGIHGLIVSDYGYGAVTPRVFESVLAAGRRLGAPVLVDSRYELLRFRGATVVTPNEQELEQISGMGVDDEVSLEKAGRQVLDRLECRYLLVTRGSRGMVLLDRQGGMAALPIFGSDEIADVTGAGDTVIAAFTLGLVSGADPVDAARLANVAGGLVVMKRGTATVTQRELVNALGAEPPAAPPSGPASGPSGSSGTSGGAGAPTRA
jgi:rfaE bifunctional protein kinase chain/domain